MQSLLYIFLVSIITTPSGFEAEILLPEGFAEGDGSPKGLRYIGEDARARIQEVLLQNIAIFDVTDIAEDMRRYGFGYADGTPVDVQAVLDASSHLFPVTTVSDDAPNCLWHADRLRMNMGGVMQASMEPSAITLLHAAKLQTGTTKETGFGSPAFVAKTYNEYYGDPPMVEETAESLREFAEGLTIAVRSLPEAKQGIRLLLEHVQKRTQEVLRQTGRHGTHWVKHAVGRTILFRNDIVHANDLIRHDSSGTPRNQTIWRRMVPGKPLASFNEGIGSGEHRKR